MSDIIKGTCFTCGGEPHWGECPIIIGRVSCPFCPKLKEEITRLKRENDQLEATNIRVTQMVSDFKARVQELEKKRELDIREVICK